MITHFAISGSKRLGTVWRQIVALSSSFALLGCGGTTPPIPNNSGPNVVAQHDAPKSGTTPGTSPPVSTAADPAPSCPANPAWVTAPSEFDAKTFPGHAGSVTNCDFHQWSYQTFLWLTSSSPDQKGRLVFEGFADPADLFTSDGKGPGEVPYPGNADANRPLKMLARVGKSQNTVSATSVFQAGPGNKALIDQNGEMVYYSNHLNKTYWDFIVDNQFYDLAKLQADTNTDFAVGSIELKVAWRIARKQKDGEWGEWLIKDAEDRFHVTESTVPVIGVNEQGQIVTKEGESFVAKLAMVGMHVVGVVENNPEFIWATFEHVDNAPTKLQVPTKEPDRPWSFYKTGTPLAQLNQFDVNNPLGVVNVCLVYPHGGGSTTNVANIELLNTEVKGILEANAASLPKWAPNYFFGGAIWTNGDIPLNNGAFSQEQMAAFNKSKNDADLPLKGSFNLANTTMETFTQSDNCFACHNAGQHSMSIGDKATVINAKHINLSHFVVNYQTSQQIKSPPKE